MRQISVLTACGVVVGSLLLSLSSVSAFSSAPHEPAPSPLNRLTLPFIAHEGKDAGPVAFRSHPLGIPVVITKTGEILYIVGGQDKAGQGSALVAESFRSDKPVVPYGSGVSRTAVSSFIGRDPTRWEKGLPTYPAVSFGEVLPGIWADLSVKGRTVEKVFTAAPYSDPSAIRVEVKNAETLTLNEDGELLLETPSGSLSYSKPVAYQVIDGERREVMVAYTIDPEGQAYGFALGQYDRAIPLIIDPVLQSTYLGGSSTDEAFAVAVNPVNGDVYIAGYTQSANFPVTPGAFRTTQPGGYYDAYVARFSQDLVSIIGSTYLGGTAEDQALALAVDPQTGDVCVTGYTWSNDFPTTLSFQKERSGSYDAFITCLAADLASLTASTYLGGGGDEKGTGIAIHPTTRDIYVGGPTTSYFFPGVKGGAQEDRKGGDDVFVSRFDASLGTLKQSTYVGGNQVDKALALAMDPNGDILVVGWTASSDLLGISGGAQSAFGGGIDGFVTRIHPTLTNLIQSTYLGGSGNDVANALTIDPSTGNVYVAGYTQSNNFPGTTGGFQAKLKGDRDAFVSRLPASLTTLSQSTYLGGSSSDEATSLVIHPQNGDLYVAGYTSSWYFPGTTGGLQPDMEGWTDVFISRLAPSLQTLAQSTFLGGGETNLAYGMAVHQQTGNLYVTGSTNSTDFPATASGAQKTFGGGSWDAFVSTFGPSLKATITLTVNKSGSGTGTVTSSPAGISCGPDCSYGYNRDASVELTATASADSIFVGWSGGGCSGKEKCTVTMDTDKTVTATFARAYTLTVARAGSGYVTSNPAGISCGSTCAERFAEGTLITLTADTSPSSVFTGWSGGGCSGAGQCVITLNDNTTVTATFTPAYLVSVVKVGKGAGVVTSAPPGITCGSDCSEPYAQGTAVTLSAVPSTGSTFGGWSGGCSGKGSCTITVNAVTTINATFDTIPTFALTVTKKGSGSGRVTSDPEGIDCGTDCLFNFVKGVMVVLTATANEGFQFAGWSGCDSVSGNTCAVTMAAAKFVSVYFSPPCTYSLSPSSKAFTNKGGSQSVTVTGKGENLCPAPTVGTDLPWITATPPVTWLKNKGTVKIIASANSTSTPRSGAVTIAGLPFAVSQAGTPCTIVKFLPTSQSVPQAGGDYAFTATVAPSDCTWTTNTTAPAWITLNTSGGTGEGVVSYTVAANSTGKPLNGAINVVLTQTPTKKKAFAVKQAK